MCEGIGWKKTWEEVSRESSVTDISSLVKLRRLRNLLHVTSIRNSVLFKLMDFKINSLRSPLLNYGGSHELSSRFKMCKKCSI